MSRVLVLCLFSGATFLAPLDAAPKRKGTTNSKASTETPQESENEVVEQATPVGPMVLSRRIVTKIDGVVVEDREASTVPAPPLPDGINNLPRDTVVDARTSDSPEESRHILITPEESIASSEAQQEPPKVEQQPTAPEETGGGFFDNFFNPQRDADPNANRFGKRRGTRINKKQIEEKTTELPIYETFIVPGESVFVAASPNITVGRIVSINPSENIAVAWMESRFITLERDVVARNHEMQSTGLLSPTTFRNGKAYGLKIVSGKPRVGDEVVLPALLESENQ